MRVVRIRRARLGCAICAASLQVLAGPAGAEAPPVGGGDEVAVGEEHDASPPPDGHAHEHGHEDHGDAEVIIVTHSPLEHAPDELAIPIDRISREQLIEQMGSTLGDTLARRPGVATSGFAAGASRPVIRGQDAFRTEVVEGGLSTQDVSRLSPDHGIPVNPLAVEFVEIIRGPATLRYGGGASAGVVNAVTNSVPHEPLEGVQGEVYGAYGWNAAEVDLAAELEAGLGEKTAFHIDGLSRDAGDYDVPGEGGQPGTAYDTASVSVGASRFGELGRLGLAYSHFSNEYGIPEDEEVEIDMRTNRVRVEGDLLGVPGLRELRLRGVYTDYQHDEVAEGVIGQTFENDEFELRLEALHEGWRGFVGAVGLQARYRDFEAGGEAAEFLAPTESDSVALYLFEERSLTDRLTAELGFRAETARVDGEPRGLGRRQESFVPLSGSLSLVADPVPDWTLGLTAAVTQRPPSAVELFARGPHEATGTFELGDPGLDPETGFTGELRVQSRVGPLEVTVSPFVTFYQGYVFGRVTGETVDEDGDPAGDELEELRYEARDVLFAGLEVALETELFELGPGGIGLDAQLDYVRARFAEGDAIGGDRDLPRITPLRWGAGLFWESERVRARVGFLRVEDQDDVALFERPTGAYTLVDASLLYRLSLPEEGIPFDLFLVGRNLANESARNHVAFNKDEVRLPGISVRGGVRASF